MNVLLVLLIDVGKFLTGRLLAGIGKNQEVLLRPRTGMLYRRPGEFGSHVNTVCELGIVGFEVLSYRNAI